jgi:hypothetical protein
MTGAVAIVGRVHRALALLRASDNADAAWLAEALATWLAGAPWEGAAGLAEGWRALVHQQAQDAAMAGLTAALPPGSARSTAAEIERRLARYQAGRWRQDRAAGRRPAGIDGLLHDYLLADGALSAERIRRRLAWVTRSRAMTQNAA